MTTRDTTPSVPPVTTRQSSTPPLPPPPSGLMVTPAMVAVVCSLTGLLAIAAGAIGSYAVTGWRVTALETHVSILEADLRSARADTAGQDKRVAIVEEQIRQLVKGVERVEGATQRIEAKLDSQRPSPRQPRRNVRRFLRPAWRPRLGAGALHPPH